jgi:hypothetical protein
VLIDVVTIHHFHSRERALGNRQAGLPLTDTPYADGTTGIADRSIGRDPQPLETAKIPASAIYAA